MDTDRKLLELAAKAAGINRWYTENGRIIAGSAVDEREWNPLTDDGDALRLAVMLGMYFECNCGATEVRCAQNDGNGYITQRFNGDPYAATRRAIVMAAAEVGRSMS